MRYLLVALFAMIVSMSLFAQAPDACCEMKITPAKSSRSALEITVTDLNQPLVTLFKSSPEMDFDVRVTNEAGTEVNRTEHGRQLLTQERGGSRIPVELRPGESTTQTLDLQPIFELKSGSTYNVEVSRIVFVDSKKVSLKARATVRIP